MATTQSISPLPSPQIRRSRVVRLPRILAQDLRALAAAEALIDLTIKKVAKR